MTITHAQASKMLLQSFEKLLHDDLKLDPMRTLGVRNALTVHTSPQMPGPRGDDA